LLLYLHSLHTLSLSLSCPCTYTNTYTLPHCVLGDVVVCSLLVSPKGERERRASFRTSNRRKIICMILIILRTNLMYDSSEKLSQKKTPKRREEKHTAYSNTQTFNTHNQQEEPTESAHRYTWDDTRRSDEAIVAVEAVVLAGSVRLYAIECVSLFRETELSVRERKPLSVRHTHTPTHPQPDEHATASACCRTGVPTSTS
jgi:hypothetical protein